MNPDSDCLARLRRGDSTAIEELYDRHTNALLYPVALRILGRPSDAEEVVQESWIQVWRTADRYDPERGSVRAWLATIVRSRAIDRGRAKGSRSRFEAPSPAAHAATPTQGPKQESDVEGRDRRVRIRRALGELSPEQRRVLELAYFGGMSQSAIARRMERPLGTVKSWARQGLERLRCLLDGGAAP